MNERDVALANLAANQHGVVSRAQALALGLSSRQLDQCLEVGSLVTGHQGVYRFAACPRTFEHALMAACLASGGVASHRAAARLLGLRGIHGAPVEISVLRPGHHDLRGVLAHRTEIDPVDVDHIGPIPVTGPARTLFDLGAVAPHLVLGATEDARLRGLVSTDDLWDVLVRAGGRGRRGAGVMRRMLESRDPAWAPTESTLEDKIVAVLRRFNVPDPVRQHPVSQPGHEEPLRLDVAYPEALLDIEGDGLRWHLTTADAQRDRDRANFLVANGWVILRFTDDDVRNHPAGLAQQVAYVRRSRLALRPAS